MSNQPDNTDDILDDLLHRQTVKASDDFAARVFARLEERDATDEAIDRLFKRQPVKPSARFTESVRQQTTERRPVRTNILVSFFRSPTAMAAVVVFAFGMIIMGQLGNGPQGPVNGPTQAQSGDVIPGLVMEDVFALAEAVKGTESVIMASNDLDLWGLY